MAIILWLVADLFSWVPLILAVYYENWGILFAVLLLCYVIHTMRKTQRVKEEA